MGARLGNKTIFEREIRLNNGMQLKTSPKNFLCHSKLRKFRIWAYVLKPQSSVLTLTHLVSLHLSKSLINVPMYICVFARICICT